jgi:hypothetical protein
MKIDEVGDVGVVLTEANVPILTGKDQVIGYRALNYEVYKSALFARQPLVPRRHGWAWQTRQRLVLLDDDWVERPDGSKAKRYHEVPFEECLKVIHKRKRVLLRTEDTAHGALTFEFRPFGAASRLLAWLKNEKEHREKRDEGTLKSPYRAEDRQQPK